MARSFKSIIPTLALIAVVIALGTYILVTVSSDERKTQQAWNEVLDMDKDLGAKALSVMALVEKLETLEENSAECSEEAQELRVEIIKAWPNFGRSGCGSEVSLPPMDEMKAKLKYYIGRG